MKHLLLFLQLSFLLTFSVFAQPQERALPASVDSFYKKTMPLINSAHAAWIRSFAKDINVKKLSDAAVHDTVMQYATTHNKTKDDAAVLELLVKSAATIAVYDEMTILKQKMNEKRVQKVAPAKPAVKKNKAKTPEKKTEEELMENNEITVKKTPPPPKPDSLTEVKEFASLELQEATDAKNKAAATLTDMLSKIKALHRDVTANLK